MRTKSQPHEVSAFLMKATPERKAALERLIGDESRPQTQRVLAARVLLVADFGTESEAE